MLVLTRKKNESIMLGEEIKITVLDIRGDSIKLGIEAPKELTVLRSELYQAVKEEIPGQPKWNTQHLSN